MRVIKFQDLKFFIIFSLIMFLTGMTNLFIIKFDLSLIDTTWILKTVSTGVSNYLTVILVVTMLAEKANSNDKEILTNNKIIFQFSLKVHPSFYLFNDQYNLNNKIDAWKTKVKNQLNKLNCKAKPIDRNEWRKYLNSPDIEVKNKYVMKRKRLEETLSDEFIKENIYFLKVKYEHVDATTIINGYTSKSNNKFKKRNGVWVITKAIAPKFILTSSWLITLTILRPEPGTYNGEFIYNLTINIVGLVMYAIWASNYAPDYINEQIRVPQTNTIGHIKEYWEWATKEGYEIETINIQN